MKEVTNNLLKKLAGEAAYVRGLAYFEEGAVLDLKRSGQKILATVQGNEIYQVTLIHTNRTFEGSCDCPASDNFDFCKHCVAAGLHYVQAATQLEQDKSGPPVQRLSAYLMTLKKDQLVIELCELIQADNITLDQWSLRADAALGVLDHKTIRKRITAAIPYNRQLYRYQQVRAYFARVEILVDQLSELLKEFTAEQALKLVEYALTRISKALETVDDSGGFRLDSMECLHEIHIDSFARLGWPAPQLAEKLVEYYFSDQVDMYPGIPSSYQDIIGKEGLDHFQAALEERWEKLPSLQDDSDWDEGSRYLRIARPLIEEAEAVGDIHRAIELKAKMANNFHDYLRLSEYCLDQQKIEEAVQWLAKAQSVHQPSYHREGPNLLQIKVWIAQGKPEKAYDLQWQVFHKDPSIHSYELLQQIAEQQKARSAVSNCEKLAIEYLRRQIESTNREFRKQAYINSLVEILLAEQHPEEALAIAEEHRVEPSLLLRIGEANQNVPERALPMYIRYATNEVKRANNQAYQEAVDALKLAQSKLGKEVQVRLRQEVVKLWAAHRAKRNLVRLLKEAFPGLG